MGDSGGTGIKSRQFRRSKYGRKEKNLNVPPSAYNNVLQAVADSPVTNRKFSPASKRKNGGAAAGDGVHHQDREGFRSMDNDVELTSMSPISKEKGLKKKLDTLIAKINQCCHVFDFTALARTSNLAKTARSKQIKTGALNDIIRFICTTKEQCLTAEVLAALSNMFRVNLFRTLHGQDDPLAAPYDPEEDEPRLEASWPHLEIIYSLFIKLMEHKNLDVSLARKYFDTNFAMNLVELFASEDPRERDMLKTSIHRMYGRFTALRPKIRSHIKMALTRFLYDRDALFFGVAEILEFFGCIINGFMVPLKDEHRDMFLHVFLPLHRRKSMGWYHQQLIFTVNQFLLKSPSLLEPTVTFLFKHWPRTNAQKQVHFLNQIEGFLGIMEIEDVAPLGQMVFKQIALCIESTHFMVSEKALNMWQVDFLMDLIREDPETLYPIIANAVNKNSQRHWSGVVQDSNDRVMQVLRLLNKDLYEIYCTRKTAPSALDEQLPALSEREKKWAKIEAMARENAKKAGIELPKPEIPKKCPDVFMKGENISPHRQGSNRRHKRKVHSENDKDIAAAQAAEAAELQGSDDDDDEFEDNTIVPAALSPDQQNKLVRRKSMLPSDVEVVAALEAYRPSHKLVRVNSGKDFLAPENDDDDYDDNDDDDDDEIDVDDIDDDSQLAGFGTEVSTSEVGLDGSDFDDDSTTRTQSPLPPQFTEDFDDGLDDGPAQDNNNNQNNNYMRNGDHNNHINHVHSNGARINNGLGMDDDMDDDDSDFAGWAVAEPPSTSGCWMVKRRSGTFKRSRRRWFVIDDSNLRIVYYIDRPSKQFEEPRGVILFYNIKSISSSGKQLIVVTDERTFTLSAATSVITQAWEKHLVAALQSLHARQGKANPPPPLDLNGNGNNHNNHDNNHNANGSGDITGKYGRKSQTLAKSSSSALLLFDDDLQSPTSSGQASPDFAIGFDAVGVDPEDEAVLPPKKGGRNSLRRSITNDEDRGTLVAAGPTGSEWLVVGMSKADCEGFVTAANHGDFLVRTSKDNTKYIVCVNDHGKAANYTVKRNEDGKFVYGGVGCDTVEEIVDVMRVNPPKNKKGENLWLLDAAPHHPYRDSSSSEPPESPFARTPTGTYGFEQLDNTTVDI